MADSNFSSNESNLYYDKENQSSDNNMAYASLPLPHHIIEHMIVAINTFNNHTNIINKIESTEIGHTLNFKLDNKITAYSYKINVIKNPLVNKHISLSVIYNMRMQGKSGCPIFFTSDFKYAIKILRKDDFKSLIKNIEEFEKYFLIHPGSLIVRYYGIYALKSENECIYFAIMPNILKCFYNKIYDIKGHNVKRTNSSGILTENDWNEKEGKLIVENKDKLISQLESDSEFLKSLNLMDYSVIIGKKPIVDNKDFKVINFEDSKHDNNGKNIYKNTPTELHEDIFINSNSREDVFVNSNKNNNISLNSQFSIGIVDNSTEFTNIKWMESIFNFICCNSNKSSVNPSVYKERFMRIIRNRLFENIENINDKFKETNELSSDEI